MESLIKRSRRTYKPVEEIAKLYGTSKQQIYRNIKKPEFADCIAKFGNECIRVDIDKYFEICQQVFR